MKFTFKKDIQVSAQAVVSVEAETKEEALEKANKVGINLIDLADGSIGICDSEDYRSTLAWMGDEYDYFTIDELDEE